MARTAYWVIDLASYTAPTNAEIRQGQRTGGVAAFESGNDPFTATTGTNVTFTASETVTTLTAGTEYRLSWTLYDDAVPDYAPSAPQHYVWTYVTASVGDAASTGAAALVSRSLQASVGNATSAGAAGQCRKRHIGRSVGEYQPHAANQRR